jgi:hypothetical protein
MVRRCGASLRRLALRLSAALGVTGTSVRPACTANDGWVPPEGGACIIKRSGPTRLDRRVERALVESTFARSAPAQPTARYVWCGGCVGIAEYVWSMLVQLSARPLQSCDAQRCAALCSDRRRNVYP